MSDYPVIPTLPKAPLRLQPEENYAAVASAFVGAMGPWGDAVNEAGQWMQGTAQHMGDLTQVAGQASEAAHMASQESQRAANEAKASSLQANEYATFAASTANFVGAWSNLTGAFSVPSSVHHGGMYWQLLSDVSNIALHEPGVSSVWASTDVTTSDRNRDLAQVHAAVLSF